MATPKSTTTTSPSEAKSRKRQGIRKASKTASGWAYKVRALIEKMKPGTVFTAEDLRGQVKQQPPHANAWGTVLHNAAASGLIVRQGFRQGERPESHARILAIWCRA